LKIIGSFDPNSHQLKDDKIGNYCFSLHAVLIIREMTGWVQCSIMFPSGTI
jgi:hypothetical protein